MDEELPIINKPDFDYRQDELFSRQPEPKKQTKKCRTCGINKGFSAFTIVRSKNRFGEKRQYYLTDCKACRARDWRERFENDSEFREKHQKRFERYAKEKRRETPVWKL